MNTSLETFQVFPAQEKPYLLTSLIYKMARDRDIPPQDQIEWASRVLAESKHSKLLVNTDCTEAVGLATVLPRERWSEQHVADLRVWIDPDVRGQGLGRELVEWALVQAHHEGIIRVEAINYETNVQAHNWLLSLGFRNEGYRAAAIRTDEHGIIGAYVMAKILV